MVDAAPCENPCGGVDVQRGSAWAFGRSGSCRYRHSEGPMYLQSLQIARSGDRTAPDCISFFVFVERGVPDSPARLGGLGLSGRQLGPPFAPELHLRLSQRLLYLPSLSFLLAHFVQFSPDSPSSFFPRSQRFWFSANLSCLSCVRHFYHHWRGAAFPSSSLPSASLSSVLLPLC